MLTIEPHPDVAPYHNRGILHPLEDDMARWLDPAIPSREFTKPLPAGALVGDAEWPDEGRVLRTLSPITQRKAMGTA